MIDRAIGIAGVALAIISLVLATVFPVINKKLAWAGFALGILLLGAAGGIAFFPDGKAQQTAQAPVVNQGPGSAYSSGQQGGITAGTINVAPPRLAFSSQLGNDLLTQMPTKKKVIIRSIGGTADQSVANDIQEFLQRSGYQIQRISIGVMAPPPDRKISLFDGGESYQLIVAPSAN